MLITHFSRVVWQCKSTPFNVSSLKYIKWNSRQVTVHIYRDSTVPTFKIDKYLFLLFFLPRFFHTPESHFSLDFFRFISFLATHAERKILQNKFMTYCILLLCLSCICCLSLSFSLT